MYVQGPLRTHGRSSGSVLVDNSLRTQGSLSRGVFRSSAGLRRLRWLNTRVEAVLATGHLAEAMVLHPEAMHYKIPLFDLQTGFGRLHWKWQPGFLWEPQLPSISVKDHHMETCRLSHSPSCHVSCFLVAQRPRTSHPGHFFST